MAQSSTFRKLRSGPITSWEIDGETMETVTDFIFFGGGGGSKNHRNDRPYLGVGGSKITADGDYSHEIKRHLLLGRKVMTNLDNVLKSRDITLPTNICLVKVMVFLVVVCGFESWTIKKADCQIIDAFELWCWR